jgi:hypothetical protein
VISFGIARLRRPNPILAGDLSSRTITNPAEIQLRRIRTTPESFYILVSSRFGFKTLLESGEFGLILLTKLGARLAKLYFTHETAVSPHSAL